MMSMGRAAVTVASAFSVTLIAIAMFKQWATKRRWVDLAGTDRLKIHSAPTPFVGGLGIALGCLVALVLGRAAPVSPSLGLILALSLCCAALGFRDDRYSMRPLFRLGVEISIGMALAIGGPASRLFASRPGFADAGSVLGVLLVLLYVTGAINAVNMQDGLDGLAGGVTLIGCIGFAVVGAQLGQWLAVALALTLGGSLGAFLFYNFHPASVFLGDNGSYFVGFMLATIALLLTFARGTAWSILGGVLLIGVPVFDAGFAIVRRLWRGVSPLAGDRNHFYDYLAKRGLSTRAVAIVSYALQACCVSLGAACVLR